MVQEVERSTCAEELLIARQRSWLGGEAVHRDPTFAEAGKPGPEMRVGSIKAAVDVSQIVIHVVGLKVAPLSLVLAVARFHKELAQGGCVFFHCPVITERRVIVVGIDAPE